jgi:hypothetical protein
VYLRWVVLITLFLMTPAVARGVEIDLKPPPALSGCPSCGPGDPNCYYMSRGPFTKWGAALRVSFLADERATRILIEEIEHPFREGTPRVANEYYLSLETMRRRLPALGETNGGGEPPGYFFDHVIWHSPQELTIATRDGLIAVRRVDHGVFEFDIDANVD